MSHDPLFSILLCTQNRARQLPATLDALRELRIPTGWKAEVLVVDNGSTDDTEAVVAKTALSNMTLRYFYEPRKGKSNALNAGLAETRGDLILCTDDDIIPSPEWAAALIAPLASDSCDAVAGRTLLAPELRREWMTQMHRWWLASSDDALPHEGARELIGANMAFKRSVLERVPGFDRELGPGALGLAEDTLFGWQLIEAGLRIGYAPNATALHQPSITRLLRRNWLSEARKHGRSEGYLLYHWEHSETSYPRLRWLSPFAKLHLRRLLQPPPRLGDEGCPLWELSYVLHMEASRQIGLESRRPRHYRRRGLTRLTSPCGFNASSFTSQPVDTNA